MVKIVNGDANTPPQVDFAPSLLMTVHQFVMTAFTVEMIGAVDTESPGELVYNITRPLPPGAGAIVSTDDRNRPITAFRLSDVEELKIAYAPPAEDSEEERSFEFAFRVVDPEGLESEESIFFINLLPMNTMAPKVTRNTGQLLYQVSTRENHHPLLKPVCFDAAVSKMLCLLFDDRWSKLQGVLYMI